MGIFSGIELLFCFLGFISAVLVFVLFKLSTRYQFNWYTWMLLGTAMVLFIFTLAWSISSFLEGEVQAGNMGLLVFGVPTLILFSITKRLLGKTNAG